VDGFENSSPGGHHGTPSYITYIGQYKIVNLISPNVYEKKRGCKGENSLHCRSYFASRLKAPDAASMRSLDALYLMRPAM
jgi:hypothetical protein